MIRGQVQSGGTHGKREISDSGYKDRKEEARKRVEERYNITLPVDVLKKEHS